MKKMPRAGKHFLFAVFALGFCAMDAVAQRPVIDSATQSASRQYSHPSFFRKLFMGSNYRKIWETPVKAPVLYLSKEGFVVTELGGGQQTKSLQLKDAQGREWALRSIEKDASGLLLPKGVPRGLIVPILQDMISASFPYAPIVVHELTVAAGIPSYPTSLVYVGKDKALGKYDHLFEGSLCFLELRSIAKEEKTTEELMKVLKKDPHNKVLQKQVLRARLIDMLVADWDRHAEQWRWAMKDSAGQPYYFVIPRDHDQAFFRSNGLLVKLAGMFRAKQFAGFKQGRLKLERLNLKSWDFDHRFLSALDESDWKEEITSFQQSITDKIITKAVAKLPLPVYNQAGEEMNSKLKSRRNALLKEGLKYYRAISKEVFIYGTDDKERFTLENSGKKLLVSVTDKTGSVLYKRYFSPDITRRVVINGLDKNDVVINSLPKKFLIKVNIKTTDTDEITDLPHSTLAKTRN